MTHTDYTKRTSNFSLILIENRENKKTEIEKLLELLNFTANGLTEKTTLRLNDPETFNYAFEFLLDYDSERPFKPDNSEFEFYTFGNAIMRKKTMLKLNQRKGREAHTDQGTGNPNPSNPPGKEGS